MQEKIPEPPTPRDATPSDGEQQGLADFLRRYREDILLEWEHALEARLPEGHRGESILREALPGFLERLADAVENEGHRPSAALPLALSDEQALQRMEAGLEPKQAALEFGLLRRGLRRGLARLGRRASAAEWELIDESLDQGLVRAVALYSKVNERMLKVLERVSEVALQSQNLDTFLPELLRVLQEALVSVDGASILLKEDGELRLRAAAGIGARQALQSGFRLPMNEGISGQVAQRRHPQLVRVVATHPNLRSDLVRQLALRAAYSVPLLHGERLVGVAHMSSRTVFDFTPSDKRLFRTLMTGATRFIVQAEQAEHEQSARIEAQRLLSLVDKMLDAIPVGICLLDRELRFVCINATLAQLNKRSVAEHLGRSLSDIVPPSVFATLEPHFRRVLVEGQPTVNHEFTDEPVPDGPPRHWMGHYYPVRTTDGDVDGVGCVVVDITQQKQVEAQLRHASELRERVIGVVGHDLRNPLSAISASVELLRRNRTLGLAAQRTVDRIRVSAARMARMISDILDFARSNSDGGIPVHRERVNLHELCRAALEELQVANAGRQLELDVRGDGWGWWDADRLTQVLGNLVSNALRHGRQDTPVRVEVRDGEATNILMSVHNDGEPIAAALRATLFQPFRHGGKGKASSHSVGLGLYIVRQVVRAHGGEVDVTSSEDGHTYFTVRLPRGAPEAEGTQRP